MAANMNINDGQIRIDGEMTIYTALDIKNQLIRDQYPPQIEIDLSRVTEIDTAGMQLLMLIKREVVKRNTDLRLTALSPAVIEVMEICHLAQYFDAPMTRP